METRIVNCMSKQELPVSMKKDTIKLSLELPKNIKQNGHTMTKVSGNCYDVQFQSVSIEDEDDECIENKSRKERDKKEPSLQANGSSESLTATKNSTNLMDQDLEFYPIDEYNSSPSTFTAWDAFMSGNQAFFREPCYVSDYPCVDSFSYMDVIPEEEDDVSILESDTDDTGSSVSTVIDKFSRASTANSSFSERIKTTKDDPPLVTFDLEQVLSPFEQLEKELDEDESSQPPILTSQNPVFLITDGNYEHSVDDKITKDNIKKDFSTATDRNGDDIFVVTIANDTHFHSDISQLANEVENQDINCSSKSNNSTYTQNLCNIFVDEAKNTKNEKIDVVKNSDTPTASPPVPSRIKIPNTSNEKHVTNKNSPTSKHKNEKSSPQASPRKKESYPTPVVPPRMSKHLPARRTRSDPGSSETPTPSRIPRPTFIIKSATATDKSPPTATVCGQRSGSSPKSNKSPKISQSKKHRLSNSGKSLVDDNNDIKSTATPETFASRLENSSGKNSTNKNLQSKTENLPNLNKSHNISPECNNSIDNGVKTKKSEEVKSSGIIDSSSQITTKSNTFSSTDLENRIRLLTNEKSESSTSKAIPTQPPETSIVSSGTGQQPDIVISPSSVSESSIQNACPSPQDSTTLFQKSYPVIPKLETNISQMNIPKIEIISEDEIDISTEREELKEPVSDEQQDSNEEKTSINVTSSETQKFQNDKINASNQVFSSSGQTSCRSSKEKLDSQSSDFPKSKNKNIEHIHQNLPQENKCDPSLANSSSSHHRSLQDILQALDNLCLSPQPKEVEINIDWEPTEEGNIHIKEKVLTPGSDSGAGSNPNEVQDSTTENTSDEKRRDIETVLEKVDRCLCLHKASESQQTTQPPESLPASGIAPPPPLPPLSTFPIRDDKTLGPGTPAVPPVGPNVPTGREKSHAPSEGHCHQEDNQQNFAYSSHGCRSLDTSDHGSMDMLNKVEKKPLHEEDSFVDSFPYSHQFTDGNKNFQESYRSTSDPYTSLSEFPVSGEVDITATRHSSGCDDSGVFLEDLPYTPEHISYSSLELKLRQTSPEISRNEKLSSAMRQYSIDANQAGLDSDAEKSDDLGLASSSVDSADDLDGDPLPSCLKPEPPPVPAKKKPPPVPARKSVSNNRESDLKNILPSINRTESTNGSVNRTEIAMILEQVNSPPSEIAKTSGSQENYKWKSEECLRTAFENKWSLRHNEKSISVKDRIAMFSEMESNGNQNKRDDSSPLQRYGSESNVKIIPSLEVTDEKCNYKELKNYELSNLTKDPKWHSLSNIPVTTTPLAFSKEHSIQDIKSTVNVPSFNSNSTKENSQNTVINGNNSPLKVDTECKYFEKPIISNYPQTQLINNRRQSYNSLKPIRTTEDLLNRRNSGCGLLSIIESRKQPLAKLKGLVIPDKPVQSTTSKTLPTILSTDSVIAMSKTDIDIDKDWKRPPTSSVPSYKTMSLPRTKNEMRSKLEITSFQERNVSKIDEPPWRSNASNSSCNTLPKYTDSYKKRSLELPYSLNSSLSPTPPSSITSPLSPPPSSPSSICSSNASSTSVATLQQNVFQFSLSHSKPVTPIMPEKPIMSPPSLPSDIEYEGDNSEDSSTSASPMMSQSSTRFLATVSRSQPTYVPSFTNVEKPQFLRSEIITNIRNQNENFSNKSSSYTSINKNSYNSDSDSSSKHQISSAYINLQSTKCDDNILYCGKNMSVVNEPSIGTKEMPVSKNSFIESTNQLQNLYKYDIKNGNSNQISESNSSNSSTLSSEEINEADSGTKHFSITRQDALPVGKFRAHLLKVSNTNLKNNQQMTDNKNSLFTREYNNKSQNGCNEDKQTNSIAAAIDFKTNSYIDSTLENIATREKNLFHGSSLLQYKKNSLMSDDDDDDCRSSISHRTEESRTTTDDYLSDATTDSFDKSLDPDLKPRRLSQQRTVLKAAADCTDSVQKFRALAEKWEQKADTKSSVSSNSHHSHSKNSKENKPATSFASSSFISSLINSTPSNATSLKLPPSLMPRHQQALDTTLSLDRKTKHMPNGIQKNADYSETLSTKNSKVTKNFENSWLESATDNEKYTLHGTKNETTPLMTNALANTYSLKNSKKGNDCFNEHQTFTEKGKDIQHRSSVQDSCFFDRKSKDNDIFSSMAIDKSKNTKKSNSDTSEKHGNFSVSNNKETNSLKGFTNENKDSFVWKSFRTEDDKTENTSAVQTRRRVSSENKDLFDQFWRDSPRESHVGKNFTGEQRTEFTPDRNLSKSQLSLTCSGRSSIAPNNGNRTSSYFASSKAKSVSVSDIRKAFENPNNLNTNLTSKPPIPPKSSESGIHKQNGVVPKVSMLPDHKRISSFDSTGSVDSDVVIPTKYGSVSSLTSPGPRDSFGSVTSLASTTSLISPQELQQLIDEANQSLEESCGSKFFQQEIQVIILHREVPAGSIGITLAGGADYEVKEITVHKVIAGSLADRDGRIRKGDRVVSINGKNLKGITHKEALDILKAPRPEVVLVISREKSERESSKDRLVDEVKFAPSPNSVESKTDFCRKSDDSKVVPNGSSSSSSKSQVVSVELQKDGTGLGFSIEGGKDSPLGDRPILIKRIFKGGAADKDGQLEIGDEIVSVNGQSVTNMTRTEAWNFMKKLPDELVVLKARKAILCS